MLVSPARPHAAGASPFSVDQSPFQASLRTRRGHVTLSDVPLHAEDRARPAADGAARWQPRLLPANREFAVLVPKRPDGKKSDKDDWSSPEK